MGATKSLDQSLARSGMPPHPGPQTSNGSQEQSDLREGITLTDEQRALIVTNRQKAYHRGKEKAKRLEEQASQKRNDKEQEDNITEKHSTE